MQPEPEQRHFARLLQWLFFYWATGHISQNGMRVKSHLYQPDQTLWAVLTPSFQFYRDIIFRLPVDRRWHAAARLLGVDLDILSNEAGHA